MSFIDYVTYPFQFFVGLLGDIADFGVFWSVIVALCACGISYLLQMAITRRSRHD